MSDAFVYDPRVVEIREKKIEVKPLAVKNLARAAKLAAPVVSAVSDGRMEQGDMLGLLERTDEIIELCALATGVDKAWIGELNGAELLQIATAVVEVNADFFIRRLLPAATEAMQGIAGKVGQLASSSSSGPASP